MSREQAVGHGDADQMAEGDGISDDGDERKASVPTILDRLNGDCWRMVLDYVPTKDLVRSERVSRHWQELVHTYLRDVSVCLVSINDTFEHHDVETLRIHPKNRIVLMESGWLKPGKHQELFVDKFGPCIVYSYCPGRREVFERIARSCPNLRGISIEMYDFETGDIPQDLVDFVERLEMIEFLDFACVDNVGDRVDMTEKTISKSVLAYRDVETSSTFWRNFKPTNLKTLTIRGSFDFRHFLSSVQSYPKLTELILLGDVKNAHLIFGRMPNIERLCLMEWLDEEKRDITVVPTDVRHYVQDGLRNLREFVVWQSRIEDSWPMELLTCFCWRLQSVDIRCTDISMFLEEMCHALGPTLTDLRLIDIYTLTVDDLVNIIRYCQNLKSLDIRLCDGLSHSFLDRAASAARGRPEPLRVHVGGYEGAKYKKLIRKTHPELLLKIEPPPENAHEYFESMRPKEYIWGAEDHRQFRVRSMKSTF